MMINLISPLELSHNRNKGLGANKIYLCLQLLAHQYRERKSLSLIH